MGITEQSAVEESAPQDTTEPPIRPSNGLINTTNQSSASPGGIAQVDTPWHTLSATEVATRLDVDTSDGLSAGEARSRLEKYGPNEIKGAKGLSLWALFLRQVSNSLTLVLVITMGLSFGIRDFIEGGVITAVIVLNIVVGFWQDYNAEMTIESLKKLAAPESIVIRGGETLKIRALDLVPGDLVRLETGNMVPVDLRLVDGMNMSIDESFLTGESEPVEKDAHLIFDDASIALGDRKNLAFASSQVTRGRGTGVVIASGMNTQVGQIAGMLDQRKAKEKEKAKNKSLLQKVWVKFIGIGKTILGLDGTPLQIGLSKFALLLFGLAILLAIIVFSASEWVVGGEVLIYGICVAVAVIPESLIAVLTITIAVGAKAMAKSNVIIRVSSAIEAVGGVTNICSDKTGTLTQGRMISKKAIVPGFGALAIEDTTHPYDPNSGFVTLDGNRFDVAADLENPAATRFLRTIALCNQSKVRQSAEETPSHEKNIINTNTTKKARLHDMDDTTDTSTLESGSVTRPTTAGSESRTRTGPWKAFGEPTEIALHVLAMRFRMGKEALLAKLDIQLAVEFPFDSSVKKMTVVYEDKQVNQLDVYTKGATEFMLPILAISDDEKLKINEMADNMAKDGLRVLCIAHKILPLGTDLGKREDVERDLDFIGLVAIYDPPRLESKGAVRECQIAGITVHMLTGDHPSTAESIAREVGILDTSLSPEKSREAVMVAKDFDLMTDEQIDRLDRLPLVVARCSPATKVKMVSALHRRKKFCVMTGDGVNDSPALKIADVGIAMGAGSDVAKDAAKVVLTDDNFASIVKAVEEGRRLFDNIQKFLMHLLISNIAQVILLLIGLAFKDREDHSIFPLSPIEILWVNLITSSFLAIGLGLEESQPDSMFRPPHDLRVGVFTAELITDKFIYGFFMGSLCLASFALVAYVGPDPFGHGLGNGCNEGFNDTCEVVFRARATTYTTITLLLLVTAWEVKHFSRSLFNLYPSSTSSAPRGLSIFPTLWRNRFLFWAVVAGFTIMFPIVYIPVVNHSVFKHGSITWEWGVSFGCVVVYVAAIESWKAVKRRFGLWSGKNKVLSREDAEQALGVSEGRVEMGVVSEKK